MIGKGRLERLSPSAARLALAALLLVLLASLIAPTMKPGTRSPWEGAVEGPVDRAGASLSDATKPYDEDIALYEVATERIRKGEHYYDFIVPEQRSRHYPVNPGLAVRLPTLAYINAALGEGADGGGDRAHAGDRRRLVATARRRARGPGARAAPGHGARFRGRIFGAQPSLLSLA
ncbi:hypothetical protein ACFSHP_05640 [Novosphingobium panipatense]